MNHKIHRQLDKNRLPYDTYFEYINKNSNKRECLILRYYQNTEVHNQHYELNVIRTDWEIEYNIRSINQAKEWYLSKN